MSTLGSHRRPLSRHPVRGRESSYARAAGRSRGCCCARFQRDSPNLPFPIWIEGHSIGHRPQRRDASDRRRGRTACRVRDGQRSACDGGCLVAPPGCSPGLCMGRPRRAPRGRLDDHPRLPRPVLCRIGSRSLGKRAPIVALRSHHARTDRLHESCPRRARSPVGGLRSTDSCRTPSERPGRG